MISSKLKYFTNFVIVRRNFLLLGIILTLSIIWYSEFSSLEGDSAKAQIALSGIAIFFTLAVLAFALVASLGPYLIFLLRKRIFYHRPSQQNNSIQLSFKESHAAPGFVTSDVRIPSLRKPFFGNIKAKIVFDDFSQSQEIPINKINKKGNKKAGVYGRQTILLPNVNDYQIHSCLLLFEDLFRVFAWPFRELKQQGLFTHPPQADDPDLEIITNTSQEAVKKVLQHRFAKGELLDYKKYAPGDDIRRIIWKNYARNRELTVRTHDRTFPYVSHVNVLVSFYDGAPPRQPVAIKEFLLDVYKEKIRHVLDSIIEQDFTVKLIIDQSIPNRYQLEEYEAMIYQISASSWQKSLPADQFIKENLHKLQGGSNLLVFSSLCPTDHLHNIGSGNTNGLNLCFYDVAQTLAAIKSPPVIKRIFLVNAFEPIDTARRKHKARNTIKFITNNVEKLKNIDAIQI